MDPRDRQQIGAGRTYRTCRDVVAKNRAEVSMLRGAESVMGQSGKFKPDALVYVKPTKMLKDSKMADEWVLQVFNSFQLRVSVLT